MVVCIVFNTWEGKKKHTLATRSRKGRGRGTRLGFAVGPGIRVVPSRFFFPVFFPLTSKNLPTQPWKHRSREVKETECCWAWPDNLKRAKMEEQTTIPISTGPVGYGRPTQTWETSRLHNQTNRNGDDRHTKKFSHRDVNAT